MNRHDIQRVLDACQNVLDRGKLAMAAHDDDVLCVKLLRDMKVEAGHCYDRLTDLCDEVKP